MRSLLAVVVAVFLTLPVACGDDDDDRDSCDAGDERVCYCGDGKKGVQECQEDGTFENLCSCPF